MIVASFYAPRFNKWGCDYDKLLILLDKSCRKLGLEHVVISDSPRPNLNTALFDLPENLMWALLDGQRQFLESVSGEVLFVGADCLLTADLRVTNADLVITTGPFSDCKMNTGAIWVAAPRRASEIWQQAVDSKPMHWGDDQRALYAAILKSNLIVQEVPCEEHNWAPADANDAAGMPTVVHFRGRRKSFMASWARNFLGIE